MKPVRGGYGTCYNLSSDEGKAMTVPEGAGKETPSEAPSA